MSRVPVQVLVVGGGAAGVVAATALLEDPAIDVHVRVVERDESVGPGLAYRTVAPQHLLNNYASRMSARVGVPDDLLRWCTEAGVAAGADDFLPRHTYGRYLADLLDRTRPTPGSRVSRIRGEVVDLEDTGSEYVATLRSGGRTVADVVVLGLGNPPPRDLPAIRGAARAYAADPWASDLVDRVGAGQRVLLVGSGLTAVDVAVQLTDAHPDVEIVAMSRHGMLPLVHESTAPRVVPPYDGAVSTLSGLLADVRRRRDRLARAGGDWRELVEALKGGANETWGRLQRAEQEAFVRHAARYWEVARHRMAPQVARLVEGLLLDGRLRLEHPDEVDVASFDLVVNCTGPAPAWSPGWNPLVDALASRGSLCPGPHGLGLAVDVDGRLQDRSGRPARAVHVLGAARRGVEWEVAAVPDLRRQAAALVASIRARSATPESGRLPAQELVG